MAILILFFFLIKMTQNENNNSPMTDHLEMQFNQLCVIAVTDISIFNLGLIPPETQIGSSSQIDNCGWQWQWTATLTIEAECAAGMMIE